MSDLICTTMICILVAFVIGTIHVLLLGKYKTTQERIDELTKELLEEQKEDFKDDKH